MRSETATKKSRRLTQTGFDKLLASLDTDRETAGEKYLLLRKNLVRFFEIRGLLAAQEAADEVVNRLAKKLDSGDRIENANTYALGIARLVALELRRSPLQKTSNELPEISVSFDAEKEEKAEKMKCLDECLEELSDDNRGLIVGYYQGEKRVKIENRKRLAESLGIPNNALRNRAVRLRNKLENCITNCLRKL